MLSDILTEFVIKDLERIRNIYIPEVIEMKRSVNIYGFKFTGKIDRADRDLKMVNISYTTIKQERKGLMI